MQSILNHYLRELIRAGMELNIATATLSYGKFTIYCLIGPEENVLHLTFAPGKHEIAKKRLAELDDSLVFNPVKQKHFRYDQVFRDYFTGRVPGVPIGIESPFIGDGTQFQQRVWECIARIPYGSTVTYRRLAEMAGHPRAIRATGTACGANPLSLIIPCHRVTAVNGLGGFAGGVAVKKSLLALEHTVCRRA